ncbi:hypothetical protein ABW99_12935 [Pandoraea thiooxydans]|uniref:Enamine deaminase RidA n=1 Tax=Pandoraea thiooxydans TaxID=445709 RepID=A0A0G3EUI4_9BURK|nr:RidA family protein [Pandoraea thiooxydans]AKJ68977.1 hypothetical protein ABW99_12935 [Pandoraea thiooxydans]
MQTCFTPEAPAPAGHYSQAIVANGFVFVAGQLPFVPGQGRNPPQGATAQTRQVMVNVEQILRAAGSSLERIVNVTVYLTDMGHWPEVNLAYAQVMGEHKPARTVTVSPQLAPGCLLEVQVTALA